MVYKDTQQREIFVPYPPLIQNLLSNGWHDRRSPLSSESHFHIYNFGIYNKWTYKEDATIGTCSTNGANRAVYKALVW